MSSELALRVQSLPVREVSGWSVREIDSVTSTNDAVAGLPAWSALRAIRQTAGRGRYHRTWVSDEGGLWLSAVVPAGRLELGWAAVPLAAGLALCEVLFRLGAGPLHLRWPNDIMSGRRKLAGLLVDQFEAGRTVIGLGVNVSNRPEGVEAALANEVIRLVDFAGTSPTPTPLELMRSVLESLREVVGIMHRDGFAALVPRVNRWWPEGGRVELETERGRWEGWFEGVDTEGRLRVRSEDGVRHDFHAHEVLRLREKGNDS